MGGLFLVSSGDLNIVFLLTVIFSKYISNIARLKPKRGETSKDIAISAALLQFGPEPLWIVQNANPPPKSEPIKVCELELGIPRYQVPRFHNIADNNIDITKAIFSPMETVNRSLMGINLTIPIATAMPPSIAPRKFQVPDQITANRGGSVLV